MTQKICRVCGRNVLKSPRLVYKNMPKSAQYFPLKEDILNEHGVDLELYQCEFCGVLQIFGEPVPYYKKVIRASAVSLEMKLFREKQFKRFVENNALQGKKIIEIGAGQGEYMDIMQTTGVKVFGLENQIQQEHERIFQGYIDHEQYNIPGAPYDAFFCMSFLEHVPNPIGFLRGINVNLSDSAVGLIEVPNLDMILENGLFSEFIQDHLMYFTNKTLMLLLESNGFEVLSCENIWHNYIISVTVKKRQLIDISLFEQRKEQITESLVGYINKKRLEKKKVAVWGAGHQSLAILALTGIASEVSCVVDSAVFKQNRLTPGTHIPVVAPQALNEWEIGAVLVMAAAYSDEVVGIVRRDYPLIDCAVLRETALEIIG